MKTGLALVVTIFGLIAAAWIVNAAAKPRSGTVVCDAPAGSTGATQPGPATPGTPINPGAMLRIVSGGNACLGSTFQVELSGAFGAAALESLKNDGPGFRARLRLYLNHVAMVDLGDPEPMAPPPGAPEGALYLQFKLNRDSHVDDNRNSWNQFLSGIGVGTNDVTVGLSLNGGLVHESSNKLSYSTRSKTLILSLLGAGLILLIGTMVVLVTMTPMLRDNGGDSPYSLGKTQMAIWGLLVVLSFVGVLIVSREMERIPGQTLMLLGISGATGLLSLMVRSEKTDSSKVSSQSWFTDIISDENGPSFHRLQVVIWTVILAGVFVWTVSSTFSMPEFDDTLLLLLGISNGTYLGFKLKEA